LLGIGSDAQQSETETEHQQKFFLKMFDSFLDEGEILMQLPSPMLKNNKIGVA
jgi:hypothetical protein